MTKRTDAGPKDPSRLPPDRTTSIPHPSWGIEQRPDRRAERMARIAAGEQLAATIWRIIDG